MERIKQAIERAKRERDTKQKSNEQATNRQSNALSQPASIENQQTRVVDVSPDTFDANRIITAQSDQSIVGAYNVLRTQVLQRMQKSGWQTLGITSANENEGKSVTSVNLAACLAREIDKTVLLVDTVFGHPGAEAHAVEQRRGPDVSLHRAPGT